MFRLRVLSVGCATVLAMVVFASIVAVGYTSTSVVGHVYIGNTQVGIIPGTGVYGAYVTAQGSPGSATALTDSNGYYILYLPSGGTYTISASATGYCAPSTNDNCVHVQSQSIVTYTGSTWAFLDFYVYLNPTSQSEPTDVWYSVNSNYYTALAQMHLAYQYNMGSPAITSENVNSAPDYVTTPPSGASQVLKISGVDQSTSTNPDAYAYFYLIAPVLANQPSPHQSGLPLSSPMYLSFNVNGMWTPGFNGHISVDAHFTDGTVLRDVTNSLGAYIQDGNQRRVHPARESFGSGWSRVVVDLTELRQKTIDYLMVAYDNNNQGSGTSYYNSLVAFFDDIRFEMPTFPLNTIDGGFETWDANLHPYGWSDTGSPLPAVHTPPGSYNRYGSGSLLVGRDPRLYGSSTSAEDARVGQVIRVPNAGGYLSPHLTFWSLLGTTETCGCTTNDWVKVYVLDRTTGYEHDAFVLATTETSWTAWSMDLTPYVGHVLWLYIQAHHNANSAFSWGYFDEVKVVPTGVKAAEYQVINGGGRVDVGLYIDPNTYETSTNTCHAIPLSWTSLGRDSTTGSGIAIGLDLHDYCHAIPGLDGNTADELFYTTSTVAWAGSGYYIHSATIKVTVTAYTGNGGTPQVQFTAQYGTNMPPAGSYPQISAVNMMLTFLGDVDTVMGVLFLDPEFGTPIAVAGFLIMVIGIIYDLATTTAQPVKAPNTATASWAYPSTGYGAPSGTLGGGTGVGIAELSHAVSGHFSISIQASQDVYKKVCQTYYRSVICTPTYVDTISQTQYVDIYTDGTTLY